jgi:hypothetical protein
VIALESRFAENVRIRRSVTKLFERKVALPPDERVDEFGAIC